MSDKTDKTDEAMDDDTWDRTLVEAIANLFSVRKPGTPVERLCGCGTIAQAQQTAYDLVHHSPEHCMLWLFQVHSLAADYLAELIAKRGSGPERADYALNAVHAWATSHTRDLDKLIEEANEWRAANGIER